MMNTSIVKMKKYAWRMTMNKPLAISVLLAMIMGLSTDKAAFGCTDFEIKTTDGSIIVGRTMEFDVDLKSQVVIQPRGQQRMSHAPDGKEGVKWTSKYGYAMVDAFGVDCPNDGINEKGLSFAYLWLPGTRYQDVTPAQDSSALALVDVGSYLLGTCATSEEAKQSIGKLRVWGALVKELGIMPPLHIALHDADGKSAVIEFKRGGWYQPG